MAPSKNPRAGALLPGGDHRPGDEPRVLCSFCGKRRDQVAGLVVSSVQTERKAPATTCTECLDLCTEIIAEELG